MKIVYQNIKKLRHRKGIGLKEIAEKIDMVQTTFLRIENGAKIPNLQQLEKVATFFEIKVEQLFDPHLLNSLKVVRKEIEAPQGLAYSIRKFLLIFPEFVKIVKGKKVLFEVFQEKEKIIIQTIESEDLNQSMISIYFDEFLNLASKQINKDDFNIENKLITKNEINDLVYELNSSITLLGRKVEILDQNQKIFSLSITNEVKSLDISLNQFKKDIKKRYKTLLKAIPKKEEIKKIIKKITEEEGEKIITWLELAFLEKKIQELENFEELNNTFKESMKSNDWETKVKIAIPLIYLLGISIESEAKFNVKKYINKIINESEKISLRYLNSIGH